MVRQLDWISRIEIDYHLLTKVKKIKLHHKHKTMIPLKKS